MLLLLSSHEELTHSIFEIETNVLVREKKIKFKHSQYVITTPFVIRVWDSTTHTHFTSCVFTIHYKEIY